MTSKCGKNNNVAHKAIAECVTDVLTTFWRLLWPIIEQTYGNMVFYIIKKQTTTEKLFILDPVNMTAQVFLKHKSKMAAEMVIAMLISPRGFN